MVTPARRFPVVPCPRCGRRADAMPASKAVVTRGPEDETPEGRRLAEQVMLCYCPRCGREFSVAIEKPPISE